MENEQIFKMKYDITILTEDRYVSPTGLTPYIENILLEDSLIQKALEKKGFIVTRKSWSDPGFNWSDTKYALFRTTWDYFERFDEFIRWMGRTSRVLDFINPFKLAQWNLDKHYLLDLQKKGIPVVKTEFIKPLTRTTLLDEVQKLDTIEAVLKPAISGAARHTYRLKPHNIANHEKIFQRLIKSESMMVQPFIDSILEKGEVSLMVINGQYTHAVLKKARPGDFRVQDDFGGTVQDYHPPNKIVDLAERTIKACPYAPLYARVDIVWDENDAPVVSELELIEPELFFRKNERSADLLATAINEFDLAKTSVS